MIKKILIALVLLCAAPFLFTPFRRGFVAGFSEEWHKGFPDGFLNYVKNQ